VNGERSALNVRRSTVNVRRRLQISFRPLANPSRSPIELVLVLVLGFSDARGIRLSIVRRSRFAVHRSPFTVHRAQSQGEIRENRDGFLTSFCFKLSIPPG
jgi:hypothetical protein